MTTQDPFIQGGSRRTFCFLSEILGKKVYGNNNAYWGRVQDLVAIETEKYPEIEGLILERERRPYLLPTTSSHFIDLARSRTLLAEGSAPTPFQKTLGRFLVRDTLYDKQILDVDGAKVERVNDVQILVYGEKPFLVHVDVGFTGLSRRLGVEPGIRSLAKLFHRQLKDELIGWKFVQPLSESATHPVQVSLRLEQIKKLHAGELADIIEELDRDERLALVRGMDAEAVADALEEADLSVQTSVIRDLDTELAADILEEMEPAAAADVIEELPVATQMSIMAAMEDEEREQLEHLAQVSKDAGKDTAGSLMTVDFITCYQTHCAKETLELVRQNAGEIDAIDYVYCLDEHHVLRGVVSLRDLILADPAAVVSDIMHERIASVTRDDELEVVAEQFFKFRFKAIPVVDEAQRIEGIVTFWHSFDELLAIYKKLAD